MQMESSNVAYVHPTTFALLPLISFGRLGGVGAKLQLLREHQSYSTSTGATVTPGALPRRLAVAFIRTDHWSTGVVCNRCMGPVYMPSPTDLQLLWNT
jgi:hypothetical protein